MPIIVFEISGWSIHSRVIMQNCFYLVDVDQSASNACNVPRLTCKATDETIDRYQIFSTQSLTDLISCNQFQQNVLKTFEHIRSAGMHVSLY